MGSLGERGVKVRVMVGLVLRLKARVVGVGDSVRVRTQDHGNIDMFLGCPCFLHPL